jgi:hypothetical protein
MFRSVNANLARAWAILAFAALASCATPYAYRFNLEKQRAVSSERPDGRVVVDDADVRAALLLDPTGARAVLLSLTNKTDQLAQVEWTRISIADSGGGPIPLRPDVELGWIPPGGTVSARLIPFALPPSGDAAARYQGRRFELAIPMIVRTEPRVFQYAFVAQVKAR